MKTVVFCRHAKSDWPSGVPDIQRPLKKRGINDAQSQGQLLARHGFIPDRIISSPANRAVSTAEIIAQKLKFKEEISIAPSVYHEGASNLLNLVRNLPRKLDIVMIFGHNPTLANAIQYLMHSQAQFELPTCGMVCIESYATDWELLDTRNLHLRWFLVPRLMRKSAAKKP